MKKLLAFLLLLCASTLGAYENLLGVSAYSLSKLTSFEVESMRIGEYEIIIPYEVENAFLSFSGVRVGGIVGCNNFSAPYEIQGGGRVLIVGSGALTRKMCASSLESQIEAIFARNFSGRFIVQGDDEMIELVGDNGFRIRLVPAVSMEPDFIR